MVPSTSELNRTPTSIDAVSLSEGLAGTAVDGQIVQELHVVVAAGVTAADGADAGPVPTLLVAVTVNVYAVPFVRPLTVALVGAGLPVTVSGVPAVWPA